MLLRVMGWLLMIESAFMLVPLVTCLIYGESDYMAFLITVAVTFAAGALMTFCIRPPTPRWPNARDFCSRPSCGFYSPASGCCRFSYVLHTTYIKRRIL